ncbi:MAG: Ig-like domain-containing protein [Spirochaetes bacterium]|nr:Ig-like domain-containing protein [Spirochaetota bacterium]
MGKSTGRSGFALLAIVIFQFFLASCPLGVDLRAELDRAVKEGTNPKRTLVVESGPYGSVEGAGALSVVEEVPRQIKATPDAGMVFFRWEIISGESYLSAAQPLTEAANSFTLVGGDAEVRAVFTDPVVPGVPGIPHLDTTDDSGISGTDGITNKATSLTVRGVWPSGSVKHVELYDESSLLGSVSAPANGEYVIESSLIEGQHTITARAVNQSDDLSGPSTACAITVDTTPPTGTLNAQFYYAYDVNNRNPPDASGNNPDTNSPKPAGWQEYIESPNPTADVRLTITGSDGAVKYALDQGLGWSEYQCSAYPVILTIPVANRYNPTGILYKVKLMDVAGNWTGDTAITDAIPISYYFKIQHEFYYVDADGDASGTGEIWWYGYLEYYAADGTTLVDLKQCFDLPWRLGDGSWNGTYPADMACDNTYLVRDWTVGVSPYKSVIENVPNALDTYVCYFGTKPGKISLYFQIWETDGEYHSVPEDKGKDDFASPFTSEDLRFAYTGDKKMYEGAVVAHPECDSTVTGTVRYYCWNN